MPGVAAAAVATFALSLVGGASIGVALTATALTLVVGGLQAVLAEAPEAPSLQFRRGRTVNIRQPITTRTIVYGEVRVGGTYVFAHTTDIPNAPNKYLHLVIPVAGHEIDSFQAVYMNDVQLTLASDGVDANGITRWKVTNLPYAGVVRVKQHLGGADQLADADLVSDASDKWTTAHRLRGVAYLYLRLWFNKDRFPTSIPTITAIIRGKKVFDPRSSTTAWSDNAALCLRDYLLDARLGLGADASELDAAAFIAAANVCDEAVSLAAGGTEPRYTCNGVVDTARPPVEVIGEMASAMAGFLPITGGLFTVLAGAWRAPTVSIDENDLRGPIRVVTRESRRSRFNAVKGLYASPDNNWQPSDFPAVTNSFYETVDGGVQVWGDIDLPFTTSASMAQRIAKIHLEAHRQEIVVHMPCKLTVLGLRAGDVVQVNNTRMGWVNKPFEVKDFEFGADRDGDVPLVGIDLTLKETASAVYDWSQEETAVDPAPNTTLPDPFTVTAPAGLTADSGTAQLFVAGDGTVVSRVLVSWTASLEGFVASGGGYEVEWSRTDGAGEAQSTGLIRATSVYLTGVQDAAQYDIQVRAINVLGVASAWTQIQHTVVGKSAPPADVQNFGATQNGPVVVLKWDQVADLDLAGYVIRFAPRGITDWEQARPLTEADRGTQLTSASVPPGTWEFFIKAIDTSGNLSVTAARTFATIRTSFDAIYSQAHHPRWEGTLNGFLVHPYNHRLVPLSQVAAAALGWEVFDKFVPSPVADPTYETGFTQLTQLDTVRAYATIRAKTGPGEVGGPNVVFEISGSSAASEAMWDVDPSTAPMWDADPATAPMWSSAPWQQHDVGDVTGQGFRFRLREITDGAVAYIDQFVPTLDVEPRQDGEKDKVIASGGTAITFAEIFHVVPLVNVTPKGSTARFAMATNVTLTGMTIHVFDAAGSDVGGTVDWTARTE